MSAIDVDMVEDLRSMLGDDFELFLTTFRNDMDVRCQAIAEAVSQADSDAVRRAAHSLKGSSSNLGAVELSSACATLETQAHEGNLANAEALVVEIEKNRQLVLEALNNLA
ncbi:MAG TPA: Hpt domain-containing protein [Gammaproteobacteria bacterium]|nr:histidine kinase [Gammaproteobacteria bacterium]MEC8012227.1 Hpt domain-containing protein [Pseudomonadota bacterium]HBF07470.1 Hpt domain-containing protein [Gammaproteobacteria bacterium]HCK92394.1 Hpt domain-containing protein [Gammaproteobacteria bacterium]